VDYLAILYNKAKIGLDIAGYVAFGKRNYS